MSETSPYTAEGGPLGLPVGALREFIAAVMERDVPFRFRARGFSMYPAVRDGDVITVAPLRERPPRVGDVAAIRTGTDQLVVHRLVSVRGRTVESRGDSCASGDGPVDVSAVLGVVVRVERGGRAVWFGAGVAGVVAAQLSRRSLLRAPLAATLRSRRAAGTMLRAAQATRAYRRVARRLTPPVTVSPAHVGDEDELSRRLGLTAYFGERQDGMRVWPFVARARIVGRSPIVGYVELAERVAAPDEGFWIHATQVAGPLRGAGLGSRLVKVALQAARRAGAEEVRLLVLPDNAAAMGCYRGLGFAPVTDDERRREARIGVPEASGDEFVCLRLSLR